MKAKWQTAKRWTVAIGMAAIPMAMTISCDPHSGSLDIIRYDNPDFGFFDVFIDDGHNDCFIFDCHDVHFDEFVIF